MSSVPLCQHLKVNGKSCGSPALRNRRFCYFHDEYRKRERASVQRQRNIYPKHRTFDFPVLEDANAIQVALMETINGLLDCRLTERQAGLILYALQTASANLKRTTFEADQPKPDEPWVTEILAALRAIPAPKTPPDNALVTPTAPNPTDLQSSISKSSIVNALPASSTPATEALPKSPALIPHLHARATSPNIVDMKRGLPRVRLAPPGHSGSGVASPETNCPAPAEPGRGTRSKTNYHTTSA